MWGEFANPKPLLSILESINFLPDTVMLFYFPLFSILLLGFHSPVLSAGGWLQCFPRRGLCLCQPTITFPAELPILYFSSWCFSDIYSSTNSSFWKLIQHALKATFSAITEAQFSQRLWQRNFSILVYLEKAMLLRFVLFANHYYCWMQYVSAGYITCPLQ